MADRAMPRSIVGLALALALTACSRGESARDTAAAAPPVRPPVALNVGGEEEADPCALSVVHASGAGNLVVVRSGPGNDYATVDSLADGAKVWTCDASAGWTGVVFEKPQGGGPQDSAGDCEVTSPISPARPYAGPCKSGWIPSDAQEVIAG